MFQDRTCEIVFAGLDTVIKVDDVQNFAMHAKKLIKDFEEMLSGINLVLTRSLGESIMVVYINYLIFS